MGDIKTRGIDISKYQTNVNWSLLPSEVDFVILRVGYRGYETGKIVIDPKFKEYYGKLMKTSLGKGVYFFSQAINYQEGVEEAQFCLKNCDVASMNYGFWFDSEGSGASNGRADRISNANRTAAAKGFIETIEKAGGKAGIYASSSWFTSKLSMGELKNTKVWTADYRGKCGYTNSMVMWQYSSSGSLKSIPGRIDMNYCYDDFYMEGSSNSGFEDLSSFSSFSIGPASSGDRKALKSLADFLKLSYKEENDCVVVGPMTSGDRVLIVNKAKELQLPIKGIEDVPAQNPSKPTASTPIDSSEKFIWSMDYLRITQKYGYSVDGVAADTYSHSFTNALDLGGQSPSTQDYARAPFSCKIVKIYPSYNTVFFESIGNVMCLDGIKRKLVLQMTHINDSDLGRLGLKVGETFTQGEVFYREGTKGASGSHIHVAVGEGPFKGTGWTTQSNGNNCINNPLYLHKVAWLKEGTKILDGAGYKWTMESGSTQIKEPSKPSTSPSSTVSCLEVKEGTWNIRSGPGTSYPSIAIARGGQYLAGIGIASTWYQTSIGYIAMSGIKSGQAAFKLKTGNWYCRENPSTGAKTIGTVKGGQIVKFTDVSTDGWIRLENGGWVGPAAIER